jgi:hypothetical protein
MKSTNIFTRHPQKVGETYMQHLRRALFTVLILLTVQATLVIHAFFPFLLVHTASNKLKYIIQGIPNS